MLTQLADVAKLSLASADVVLQRRPYSMLPLHRCRASAFAVPGSTKRYGTLCHASAKRARHDVWHARSHSPGVFHSRCISAQAAGTTPLQNRDFTGPDALLFDCDGVLVDTEAEGHRVAFNQAFKEKGLDHVWDVELYGRLLETGGGKERMTAYFTEVEDKEPFKSTQGQDRDALIKELHLRKTDIFMEMIDGGELPLRPGVKRLIVEASVAGVPVAVCSTSNERSVSAVVRMLGDDLARNIRIFAGDIVPKKKPDPAIYTLAAKELGVDPAKCVVIEDSRIGLLAAKGAGMRCIVTTSRYTAGENFEAADAIYDCIGDASEERFSLTDLAPPGVTAAESVSA